MNKDSIRNSLKFAFGALLVVQALGTSAQTSGGHISETYVLNWNATVYSTNSAGRIVTSSFSSADVVKKILSDDGIPYSTAYTLVYRPDKRDTVVIKISDPAPYTFTPADYIQFQYAYSDFPNIYGTWTIKQAFLADEQHSGFIGSLVGFEYSV